MNTETSTIDPGLTLEGPRYARLKKSSRVGLTVVAVLCGIVLWIIGAVTAGEVRDLRLLMATGEIARGSITGRHQMNGKSTTYYLDYDYMGGLTLVNDDEVVSRDKYDSVTDDAPIIITYLPARPNFHRVGYITESRIERVKQGAVTGGFWALALFGLIFGLLLWDLNRQLSLAQNGLIAEGIVRERKIVKGKSTSYYVTYDFTVAGYPYTRKISVTAAAYVAMEEGDKISVLYERSRPKRNLPFRALTSVELY